MLLKKIEEKKRIQALENKKKNAKIATTGVTMGVLAGILLAPKSGKETINDVKHASNKVKEKVSEKTEETKEKVSEKISTSKAKIKEYLDSKKVQHEENIIEVQPILELPESTQEV